VRKCVAILDTMWTGRQGKAPAYFRINPRNRSGARLYKLIGTAYHLYVTNACPYTVTSASQHSKADPLWLKVNIQRLCPIDLLLVCGQVARDAYHLAKIEDMSLPIGHVLFMPHPAWRGWTKQALESLQQQIASL